jgi:basic amino acid/polyamine antiporter, APA family
MGYMAGFASLIMLRKKEPDLPRPYKVIAYPFIPYLLIIVSALFLIGAVFQDFKSGVYALAFLIFSYPLFWITKKNVM